MESNSPGENSTWNILDVSRTPRAIFLILFIVTSFVENVFIVIVVVHNVKLRSVQNLLIASMCVTCIIDCSFNMTIIMCFLIDNEWAYGAIMCKVNNFFMNLVTIQTILILMTLTADRYCSLRFASKYEAWLSSHRINLIITYLWVHSLAFSIPFLSGDMNSIRHLQHRLCTVTGPTSLIFVIISLLVCFLIPLLIIIMFHVLNVRITCKLRDMKRNECEDKQNYTQMRNESPQKTDSSLAFSYTILLFVSWFILEIPFLITSYIKQYEYSQHLVPGNVENSWQSNATFVWMRFVFSTIFPFITFVCKKEIWQSTKECLLCRRQNSVIDIDVVGIFDGDRRKESAHRKEAEFCSKVKDRDKETSDMPSSLAFNVPVLFATSTGICIEDSSIGYSFSESDCTTSTAATLQLKGKTLDISYPSYEYADELMDDTSDYDSSCEIDQYSSSQPVSTKNVIETLNRKLSTSDPQINSHRDKLKNKSKDLNVTLISDSGLDLSGTVGSSLGETSKSWATNVSTLISGHSTLFERKADANIRDIKDCYPEFDTTAVQRESEYRNIHESKGKQYSLLPASKSGLIRYTNLDKEVMVSHADDKQKRHIVRNSDSLCCESLPQRSDINSTEETIYKESRETPRMPNELRHNKVKIDSKQNSMFMDSRSGHI